VLLDGPTNGLDPAARDDMLSLVRRVGEDFGIAVVVTSHLLGELERVSDHVVVLDAGRLLRASATTEFLGHTGTLLVEVIGDGGAQHVMGEALAAAGLRCAPRGTLIALEPTGTDEEVVLDLVRDTADDLRVGLVRIQRDHHRIEDVFTTTGGAAGDVDPSAPV
jgi:ABC-2 type transport system ATP-binding protein